MNSKLNNVLPVLFSLAALVSCALQVPFASAQDELGKGLYREPVGKKITLSKEEAEAKLLENSLKSAELAEKFGALVQKHLQFASDYDVDAFRKNDDELSTLFEAMDANYLDSRMLCGFLGQGEDELAAEKKGIQDSKMFMYKSSAIFNLCFGRPLNSAQCGRLALNLSEHAGAGKESEPDVRYYLGSALCWAGDYKDAANQLNKALVVGKGKPYTQLKPGTPVNVSGQNPFATQQLATVLLADNQGSKAIELLNSSRASAPSKEVQGLADALLAVAHAAGASGASVQSSVGLNGPASTEVKKQAALARAELGNSKEHTFPAVAKEYLGIVEALGGNYQVAEKQLSEAITRLQDSPVKLGNRLEAAQASLWRARCRERLGNSSGFEQDMKYAMSFADEAPHLVTVSKLLDRVFGKSLTKPISAQPREKWAVVVGLGDFADPTIPKLKYPKKDAEDVAKFLVEHAGFKPDHIKTLTDAAATKENLLDSIGGSWLPSVSKPDDVVFLFVSSHGTPAYEDIGAMNSVVTYDTQMNKLFASSIPMQTIVRTLGSKLSKRHTFVILDTCYAGGLGVPVSPEHSLTNVDPNFMLSSNYQLLVSSSNGQERSWESKRYPNSVFTRQLIDVLQANSGYEQFQSVFPTIRKNVSAEVFADYKGNTQTPNFSGMWSGRMH